MRFAITLSLVATAAVATAQPSKIAWTRSNASADIVQDTAKAGAMLPNGHFVIVGGSKQPDGTMKGCLTIFNRNRAVVRVREYSRPGGGSMEFRHVVVTPTQILAIGGGGPGNIGVENDETHTVGHDHLMEEEGIFYFGSLAAGKEEITDVAVDPNGVLYMAGYRMSGANRHAFLRRQATPGATPTNIPLTQTAIHPNFRPDVTVNGIIAILIGLFAPNGAATVQSYSPAGSLNWSFGASNPTSTTTTGYKLTDILVSGYVYGTSTWAKEISPGMFNSGGRIHKINLETGQVAEFGDTSGLNGADMMIVRDAAAGQAAGKRVNVLFEQGQRGRVYSFNANLVQTSNWVSPVISAFASDLMLDQYDEPVLSMCSNEVIHGTFSFGFKLNQNNQTRFSWGMSQTGGFLLPYMEQENIYHAASGDIITIRSDNNKMQLVKVEQAPVGVTDTYQPRTGRFFRPMLPVTSNDRFAEGAKITTIQQPAHGTFSMGANGIFNYTATQGYLGVDSFKYRLTKPGLSPSTVTVNLIVKP